MDRQEAHSLLPIVLAAEDMKQMKGSRLSPLLHSLLLNLNVMGIQAAIFSMSLFAMALT